MSGLIVEQRQGTCAKSFLGYWNKKSCAWRRIASVCRAAAILIVAQGATSADASTWSGGDGNWSSDGAIGWNMTGVPNAIGGVADNPITATGATTQNVGGGVTVGTLSLSGSGNFSWTHTLTNAITFNENGATAGTATISNSNSSAGTTNALIIGTAGAQTITLADDLLVSNTGGSQANNGAIQIAGAIGGSGNVTFSSTAPVGAPTSTVFPGAIRLQTGTNTFAGSVLVQKGLVIFNQATSLGNAANVVTVGQSGQGSAALLTSTALTCANPIVIAADSGGTLTLGTASTAATGTFAYSGPITLNGNATFLSGTTTTAGVNYSGVISGNGGITKTGTGFITIGNTANSYVGDTIVTAGTLITAGGIPEGIGKGNVSLATGAALRLSGNDAINGLSGVDGTAIQSTNTTSRTLTVGNYNVSSTFSGTLLNNGAGLLNLTKTGAGLTVLNSSAASTSTGTLRSNYNGGTLRLDFANMATPTDLMALGMNLQMSSGTLEVLGKSTGSTSQTFAGINLAVNVGHDNTLLLTPNGGDGTTLTITAATPVSGLRLIGNNLNFRVTGGTGGTFNWNFANTNGIMGGWAVFESQTWAVGGTPVTGLPNSSYVSTTTYGNTALSYQVTDHIDVTSSPVLDGAISVDTLRFNTAGANTLTLQDTNNVKSGGILVTSAVGNNVTTIAGGMLAGSGIGNPSTNGRVDGTNVISAAALVVHQFNTANVVDISSTIVEGTAGVTAFVKNGPGTVKLSSDNTYSGVTMIANGTLMVNSPNAIPHGSGKGNVSVNSVLDLNGNNVAVNAIDIRPSGTVTSSVAGNVTLTVGDGNGDALAASVNGFIFNDGATLSDGAGVVALRKIGTGVLTNGAQLTYSGGTTVEDGRLTASGGRAAFGTGNVSVTNGILEIAAGVTNAIANTATLSLAGGGTPGLADLGYAILGTGINEQVSALILGGLSKPLGTYGSTTSSAMFKDDEFFSGSGLITVALPSLPGDFNNDGHVNAADYVVWRKTMPGDIAKYNEWRSHFGNPPGSGGNLDGSGAVPEPGAIFLTAIGLGLLASRRRSRVAA